MSNKPLSLRRVPPNLLVGQGATDFAFEHGIPVVPHEVIVSRNARDRFIRWKEDLRRAEGAMTPHSSVSTGGSDDESLEAEYSNERMRSKQRRDHTQALLNGTWNEGQPDSPSPSPFPPSPSGETAPRLNSRQSSQASRNPLSPTSMPRPSLERSYMTRTASQPPTGSPAKRQRFADGHVSGGDGLRTHSLLGTGFSTMEPIDISGPAPAADSFPVLGRSPDGHTSPPQKIRMTMDDAAREFSEEGTAETPSKLYQDQDQDLITDTVGAIAIDMWGRIAAGSSSGGIGMKHRGRVGPAALVGIGSAVIPADDKDEEYISAAAVTSGTGEHMATTLASQKCAERLYHNTRRARGGADIPATEEEAMESFVQADFMGHPGVSQSNSAGAIGVMAVKKTPYGYYLHFAHNTDSFAIASMHSNEKDPKCVMSRIGDSGGVVQGGRRIRID